MHPRPTTVEPHDDSTLIAFLSAAMSLAALAHYYRWSQILLSGDAVAHINIARRVFDSRTPGLSQLGTVWLPLQHLLTIPFIISDFGWSSGIGGAVPSMFGYVFGVVGVYRLVRTAFAQQNAEVARAAGWLAAVIYAANPNLIYVQTTALNEPLTMALFVWALLMFLEFWRAAVAGDDHRAKRRLRWCGWLLMADMLIRYDGWFAGCVLTAVAAIALLVIARRRGGITSVWQLRRLRNGFLAFVLLCAAAPVFWFAYNAFYWGNPLEFATGPYSAKAIEERTTAPGEPHHPGWHAPYVASEYFLKDLKLNLAEGRAEPLENIWLSVAILGSLAIMLLARPLWPLLLLWIPLPFYAIAIAWEGVPIFIPSWWPFSYYNARYALELLPMVAVFWGGVAYFGLTWTPVALYAGKRGGPVSVWRTRWMKVIVPVAVLIFVGLSYAAVWQAVPISLREVRANGGARYALDGLLAYHFRRLPPDASLLMYIGDHGGALQRAEVPLRRTINEGNFRLWEKALQDPAASADFIIAGEGDPVAQAVARHPQGLLLLGVLETPGQKPIRIYASQQKK